MLLAYASKTGNVERFVAKLGNRPLLKIETGNERIEEPCILITYTTGMGQVPLEVESFMHNNRHNVKALACSGNRNWGANFAAAGHTLAERFNLPLLHTFELSGRPADVTQLLNGVDTLAKH